VLDITIVDGGQVTDNTGFLSGGNVVDITGQAVSIAFYKPDNTLVIQDETTEVVVLDAINGRIECTLLSNTIAAPGIIKAEVSFAKDGNKLSMEQFNFAVSSSLDNGSGLLSSNQIPVVEAQIADWQTEVETIKAIYNDSIASQTNVEIIDARNSLIKSTTFATLDARLEESEQDHVSLQADVANIATINLKSIPRQDGETDDTLKIQRIIDGISAPTKILVKGIYTISSVALILNTKSDIWFIGADNKSGFKLISNVTNVAYAVKAMIQLTNCFNVTFSDLYFDGNLLDSHFIGLDTCEGVSIKNNTFTNITSTLSNSKRCVYSVGSYYTKILNNKCFNVKGGFVCGNTTRRIEKHIIVQGNQVYNTYDGTGINLFARDSVISGNIFYNCAGSGIALNGDLNTGVISKNNVVSGNVCSFNLFSGIQSDSTSGGIIEGASITGNFCEGNLSSGIYMASCKNWTVMGNTCKNNIGGIEVLNAQDCVISSNNIFDTRVGVLRTQRFGIRLTPIAVNMTNILINNNIINNHTENGIYIGQTGEYFNNNINITGNIIIKNVRGVYVNTANTNVLLGDNIINDNDTDANFKSLDITFNNNISNIASTMWTFTNNETTPSVKGGRTLFEFDNSTACTITNFLGGVYTQRITVWFTTANTTLSNGSGLILKGGIAVTPQVNDVMQFVWFGAWYEVSRSF